MSSEENTNELILSTLQELFKKVDNIEESLKETQEERKSLGLQQQKQSWKFSAIFSK